MPGHNSTIFLAPFPPTVTKIDVQNSSAISDPTFITGNLLSLSQYLVGIVSHTTVFGPGVADPYQPCLATLHYRLTNGIPFLTPLSAIAKDAERLRETLGMRIQLTDPSLRPLEDFEDLYYAVLARMQEMLHTLDMRITSGFNSVTDTLFPGGPSIQDWHASATAYWETLNDAAFVRTLDDAVRQGRVTRLYEEVMARLESEEITHEQAAAFLEELYHGQQETEGMMFIEKWEPLHVGIELEQKYRVLFRVEREEDERRERMKRRRSMVPKKEMGVKKTRGKSPRKRPSIEKILENMHGGLAVLQDRDGGETRDHQFGVQQVDGNMRIEGQDPYANEQDHNHLHQPRRGHAWQAKHQRVSDYSKYLRVQANYTARLDYGRSTYNGSPFGDSMDAGILDESPGADTVDKHEDMMEF